jgi:hypothetical protein
MKVILGTSLEPSLEFDALCFVDREEAEKFILSFTKAMNAVWPRPGTPKNGGGAWQMSGLPKSTYYRKLKDGKL